MPDTDLGSAYAQCAEQVRREDPDRFFASLFWSAEARPHAHAILAFNLEVAKVREQVSEPTLGEMRLQWWRDTLERGVAGGHPIAEALLDTIRRFSLDPSRFLQPLEARAFDLYDDPMPSQTALDGYVRDTSSILFEAIAQVLALGQVVPSCVEPAGRAYARTGLLRSLPFQVMRGQLFLPLDVLAKFQLPPTEVLAHRNSPALGLVLNAMRASARNDLDEMRMGLKGAGPATLACLPAVLCDLYLKAMERPGLDPFKTPIEVALWRRQFRLWRGAKALAAEAL